MPLPTLPVRYLVAVALLTTTLAGCQNMNRTQQGAALGTGLGAALGAIIGHQSGNRDKGALIGGVAGLLGGSLLGNAEDVREERDAVHRQINYEREHRRAAERAVKNTDVMRMTANSIDDDTIIRVIQTEGGRFDTSADAIIELKHNNVSDAVIRTMQQYN